MFYKFILRQYTKIFIKSINIFTKKITNIKQKIRLTIFKICAMVYLNLRKKLNF